LYQRGYPGFFKVAKIRPVFKSEDLTEFSNRADLEIVPTLSGIYSKLEKCVVWTY
jgi:hypothetical protein